MRLTSPRLLRLLVLLASLPFFAGGVAAADPPRVYLALGDSVAYGTGASSPFVAYVTVVFQYLQGLGAGGVPTGVSLAVSGETSGSFISGGQLANALARVDAGDDIAVVTLSIGGNDVLNLLKPGQPCADTQAPGCAPALASALNSFTANYTTILQQLTQALNNDPGAERLLVMTYYNPFSGVGGAALPYARATELALLGTDGAIDCSLLNPADPRIGLNDLLACIGQFYGATVVDVYARFSGRGAERTHVGDPVPDIHPNDAGHAAIADAFIRTLANRLYLPIMGQLQP